MQKKLQQVEEEVDVLNTLGQAVRELWQRFLRAKQKEQELLGGLASPQTDRAAQTLLEAVERYWKVAQSLGLMPTSPPQTVVQMNQVQQIAVSEEELKRLEETLDVARRIVEGDLASSQGAPGRIR